MNALENNWGKWEGEKKKTKNEITYGINAFETMYLWLGLELSLNPDWDLNSWSLNWDHTWSWDLMKLRFLMSHQWIQWETNWQVRSGII